MASDNIPIDDQAMEELRRKSMEIECHNKMLIDENRKRGIQYEELLKEKSELERKIGFLELTTFCHNTTGKASRNKTRIHSS